MSFTAEQCYIYTGWRRNQTDLIVSGYEGVPQNLILNIVLWMVRSCLWGILIMVYSGLLELNLFFVVDDPGFLNNQEEGV